MKSTDEQIIEELKAIHITLKELSMTMRTLQVTLE